MNTQLLANYMAWKVGVAIKRMAPLKAPSLNNMPPLFYQNYWQIVGNDVTQPILNFLNTATLPSHLNHRNVTLIPKVKSPELIFEYRPISLCNILYKIFSKVLANRLKKVLPNIITKHQSAFTKSKLISDNILVAFETLHSMQKHKENDNYMAIKVDMSRTYDKVQWSYLEVVMKKKGFEERWIKLMMVYVKTITYSILVNGESKGLINLTRGIHQEDPFSPFLFLLCMERLHGLISQEATLGNLRGFSLYRIAPD